MQATTKTTAASPKTPTAQDAAQALARTGKVTPRAADSLLRRSPELHQAECFLTTCPSQPKLRLLYGCIVLLTCTLIFTAYIALKIIASDEKFPTPAKFFLAIGTPICCLLSAMLACLQAYTKKSHSGYNNLP